MSEVYGRPTWGEICKKYLSFGGYVICSCHHVLQTIENVKEHWQQGHFDIDVKEKEDACETNRLM